MKTKLITIALLAILSSCMVSKKKFDELAVEKGSLEVEKADAANALKLEQAKNDDLELENEAQLKKIAEITNEKAKTAEDLKNLKEQYQVLSQVSNADAKRLSLEMKKAQNLQASLEQKNNVLASKTLELETKTQEMVRLGKDLEQKQSELDKKNLELEAKNQTLKKDRKHIDSLNSTLADREKRVVELEEILRKQEEAVEGLRSKITASLLSFSSDELQIEVKDGKVYVSLAENLLFKSGKYTIDPKGIQALKDLSVVLAKQTDVDIVVEGHTDDVPYNGSGVLKDNWDLSVKRATTVVRELEKNSVDSKRLVAAGRGENLPKEIGTTKEVRAINRRIEIIISPSLGELYKLLEAK